MELFWRELVKDFVEDGGWSKYMNDVERFNTHISYADFNGFHFSDFNDFSHITFYSCDFRGARLPYGISMTRFSRCDFTDAVLEDLYTSPATFERCNGIIGPYYRHHGGYTFYAVQFSDQPYRIAAGCQWKTYDEYVEHALDYGHQSKTAETLAILYLISLNARRKGWILFENEGNEEV